MSVLLLDVSIRTMIGQLPNIINYNNKQLSDYIDNIYDSSKDCIKVSIDNLTNSSSGYVKSFTGIFKNLTVDNLIVNGISNSFKDVITSSITHNDFQDRYLYNNKGSIEPIKDASISELKPYAHNGGAIGIVLANGTVCPLSDVINNIITNVDELKSFYKGNLKDGRYVSVYGVSNDMMDEPKSFTFDNSLLFASKVLLKRMNLPLYQYNDITSGFLYTYYDYSNVVTINDEHTASIKGIPGSLVNLKFDDLKKKAFYRILLSRKENKFLRISKDELNRITLICTGNDDTYGSTWDVLNYSVRSSEDIMIERK